MRCSLHTRAMKLDAIASERLAYREEEFKVAQLLCGGTAGGRHADLGSSAGNQVLYGFVGAETDIARRVERVCQIHAYRAERRLIPDSKAGGLNRVVKIRDRNWGLALGPIKEPGIRLRISEGNITESPVNIPH